MIAVRGKQVMVVTMMMVVMAENNIRGKREPVMGRSECRTWRQRRRVTSGGGARRESGTVMTGVGHAATMTVVMCVVVLVVVVIMRGTLSGFGFGCHNADVTSDVKNSR